MSDPFVTSSRFVLCGNFMCQNPVCEVHDATFRAGVARILLAQNAEELDEASFAHLRAQFGPRTAGRPNPPR